MPPNDKVAVIGAGALGLMALKQFKEDGFDVTGFESRPYVGGLWKDSRDSTISVHASTVFNTSKFRAAISDFPFPESTDNFPTATQMHDYLCSYADHFDVKRHVKLNTKVKQILRENGQWILEVEDVTSGSVSTQRFDRVAIATGSYYAPRWPKLEGLEKFSGKAFHSIDFHTSESFKDQNLLLIGMHATALDTTTALSGIAKHVYLSHRHGLTLLPSYTPEGEPSDTVPGLGFLMVQSWLEANMPATWTWLFDKVLSRISNAAFPNTPDEWGFRPAPSIAVATPVMGDSVWPHLKSGFAEPVPGVKHITGPKTVELTNGRVLTDIDTIIYCTGYDFDIPEDLIPKTPSQENLYHPYPNGPRTNPYLYRNIFPLTSDETIRNTLAFIGHSATPYPGFVQFELACMAVSQIWVGNKSLPDLPTMKTWHATWTAQRAATIRKYNAPSDSTFYPALLPFAKYFPWMNEMAGTGLFETMGGKCNGMFNARTWELWWRDRELYDLMRNGILTPTVFRVFEMESGGRKALGWEEGKRRLRRDNEVYQKAVRARGRELGLDEDTGKPLKGGKAA
ncbi:hypothetical protein PMZ80_007282 [Knufia obscura]|uniref:Flavin-containing monooxygenase n=2 Tax=Knufia TaxID=430999 RepID=A0AAN8EDT7_9EURO|nr:hypothetical protein PMZ80_007282 [Knufia obscura]KAK5953294.1 hypothetical protein OHC33_005862 [Knufia fluminis]